MTEFWENHLHVPVHDDGVFTYRADYGKVIRSHALGRFDQMLVAAITHPAMGISLDNARSTKKAPNENLGRELLELHTVGKGNHTEDDVKDSAKILTGYRVDMWTATWRAYYDTASHWTGAVKVLDFTDPNTDRRRARRHRGVPDLPGPAPEDGREDRAQAGGPVRLRHARPRLSWRTWRRCSSTTTPRSSPVLRALVASPEFKAAAGLKARTPTDDVVATHRVLRTEIAGRVDDGSAANSILWQTSNIGQQPFEWARPDGQPEDNRSWSSASRLLASLRHPLRDGGGWWPKQDMTYRDPLSWMPAPKRPVRRVGRPPVQAAPRQAAPQPAADRVHPGHRLSPPPPRSPLARDHALAVPVLLTTLLDTPDHMHR